MRLHSLELAAVGPFARTQHIDFEQLQASGLFLLDGPTGAGKTTVLDAITFALYGPGGNRGDGRLHSDFAGPETEPFVTVEFSVRAVRYRLRRTPEYERPKRRGGGMTTAHATAHLERFEGGSWISRSSNKAEIAEIIDQELGLTREQFRQVVVLPQGDFATFLRATDDERRAVLSRLFGTGLYQRLTDELDTRRADAVRDIATARERLTTGIAVAAEAAGLSVGERDELCTLVSDERRRRFDTLADDLEARRATAELALENAASALAVARAAAETAASEDALVARFVAARTAHAAHLATATAVDSARTTVRDAARAEPVRALLDAVAAAEARARRAHDAAAAFGGAERVAAALDDARLLMTAGEVAASRREAVATQVAAAQSVVRLTPTVAAARRRAAAAVDAHQAATDEHLRLLELRLAGMAGELAGALVEGERCSVCGSLEHPAPAQPASDAVDVAQVRAAQARRAEAERRRRTGETALAEAERELAVASSLAGDCDPAVLSAELDEIDAAIAAAAQATAAEPRLLAAAELVRTAEAAATEVATARDQAVAEAVRAGFPDLDSARAAVLDREARSDLEARIAAWDASAAALSDALQAPEFARLRQLAAEDLDAHCGAVTAAAEHARAVVADAEAAHTAAAAAVDAARRAAERFAARGAEVDELDAALQRLETDAATVVHLAKLARGMAGQRRVALTTYVLRHWFERVVLAANVRLNDISSGRYALVRVDEGETKSERTGLTLHVVDAHTGEARTPRSLSGGETFYTSLALALGLADVVRAEAGGVDLDTLFIDEGFGALDSDTLEQVMSVIDELRDRGRVVGIVSHVTELKERIPERLEVRRLPDGSSALRVVA